MSEANPTHPPAERIEINLVRVDGGTQPRAGINQEKVIEYSEVMASGVEMDPALVYFDGSSYWLVDGFHRLAARVLSGSTWILCEIRQGTQADAQWASYGVNAKHGLPRTNEDKRRAVIAAFGHPRSAEMSDRALAAHCGVSDHFVGVLRKEFPRCDRIAPESRIGRDGKKYPAQRAKKTPAPVAAPDPRWPVPNRFGMYAEDNAIEVPHEHDGAKLRLRVLRVGDAAWIYAFSVISPTAGTVEPLSTDCVPEAKYEDAIAAAASEAAAWLRELRANSDTSNRTRRQIGPLLAWLCTMGAPPDVHESGPVDEPEEFSAAAVVEMAPNTAIWRNMQEIRQMRAGLTPRSEPLSPDALELQRVLSFLGRPLNWQRIAAEIGLTDDLRAQVLKGRDVLDAVFQRVVQQLSA